MTNFNFLFNPVAKNEVNRALAAAKTLQNAGGGTSQSSALRSEGTRHKALIIAKQFSQYCVSQSEGAQVTSARSAVDVPMTSYGASDEHPMSTRSASDGTRWNSRGWKYAACMLMVLVLSIGQAWGVKSTFTKGETIFIYQQTTNSAWRDNADVKAWFKDKDSESGGEAVYTNWLCDGDNSYKVWYVIVPQASLNQVRIQRFEPGTSNCWTGNEFSANQSDRGNDDYNVLWSENSSGGWKNETFGFTLKGSPNSWSGNLATFEDMGDGYFQCTYTYTPTNTQDEFKIYDSWGHAYGRLTDGNNFLLQGLKAGQECTILASFKIQDCSSANRTSLNIMVIHEPGTYEKATGSGGYGKTLRTYNGTTTGNVDKKFELYYFQASSSKGILYAGESSPFTLFSNAASNTSITATDGWIEVNARAYENSGGTQKDEMSNGNSSISTQAAKLATSSNHIQLAIFGYDQFTFFGKDVNANDATKQFLVKIDGTTQSITHQTTDNTAYRFNLDGGRHLIEIFGTGTDDDSHENNFRAFSLRPAAPTISATSMAGYTYNQGATATAMTVTATPVVAGHTLTYTWYKNSSATMSGATQVQSSTSSSYTPSTETAGGLYYVCVVSEEGCNTSTTAWSGLITVNAVCTPLGAVAGLTCNDKSTTELQFAWAAFGATATGVTVTLYSDEDCTDQVATVNKANDANVHRFTDLEPGTTYWCTVQTKGDGSTYCTQGGIAKVSGTTSAAATLYTVTYNVNGAGSVAPASATQASADAAVTLPTPTWSGYTFEGWYNNGTKIGDAGASYTPTANITLYAYWTDDISGKVFSYIDNNYGDKFKGFDGETWVTADADGNKTKTYTHGTTGVQFAVTNGSWGKKNNAISSLAKFKNGTTSMSVVVPAGKIATVKISYGAYNTGNKLTVNSTDQTAPSTALTDGMTNAQVFAALKEITLNNQTGTLTLGSSTGNIYIGRVSATITGYTVTYAKGSADGASGDTFTGTKTAGSSFTLSSSSSAFTRDGYTYDGWSTNEDGSTKDYNLGGSYTTDAPVTLYPHWVAVCSGPNGGSATYTAGGYDYEQGDDANTMSLTGMAASNGGALSYQWYKTTSDYAVGEAIDGATSNTYTPSTAVVHAANWYYFCVVTEAGCATTYRSALSGAIVVNPAVCFNLTLKTDGSAGDVNEGTAITTSNYASTLTGGVARVGGSKSTTAYSAGANGGLTLDDNSRQIDVDLDYLTQVGSIITVKFYLSGSGTNYGIKINGQAKWTVSSSSGSQTLSYTLTGSDTELIGKSHLTIARNADSPVFQSITVANCSGTEAPCFSISDAGKNGSTTLSADTVTNAIIDGTIRGGQVKWTGGSYDANDADGIIFNADDDEITITLWGDKALDEGSVISITQHGNSSTGKATGFKISGNSMSPATYTNSSAKEENTQTYTVPEGSALIGKQSFTIKWTGSNQVYLKAMNITGCGEYSCTAPTSPSIAISDNDGDNDHHLSSSELTFTASATGTDGSTTYTWYRCQTADDVETTKASGTPIQAASTSTTYTISFLKDGNLAAGGDEAIYLCKISNGTGCDVWAQTSLDVTPAASVSITYHLNGASWVGGYTAPSSYRPGAEGATLPIASNMVNTGYTFGGWYANSDLSTGGVVTSITTSDSGAKEYWAKWTENTYTITYDKNGGTGSDMSTTVGHYVTLSNNSYTAPSGKIFAEWNTAFDGSGASHSEGEEIELTADMTLYAIWASDYTITWDASAKLGGVDATPNLGGGNYTITASVSAWTGTLTADMVSTPTAGVTITNVALDNSASPKTATVTFAVTEEVTGDAITLTIDVPANGSYGAKSSDKVISISRCEGGTTLFSQDFDEATEVAYTANTERSYSTSSTLSGLVGSGANLFTSIACNAKNTTGIAINTSSGGNSSDVTGAFQAYYNNTDGYWSITRTADFAGTAPTAVKVNMDIWFKSLSSGSYTAVNFAIGNGFADGLKSSSAQDASKVHSGFSIINSTPKLYVYNSTSTSIESGTFSAGAWYSFVWVINNTGSDLTYDNPTGSGTTTLANDKYDIWRKAQGDKASKYTLVASGKAATTGSVDLQEIYIGHASGKKHEFRLDNVRVVSLSGVGGKVSPTLTWSAPATVDKETGNADFTYTASTTSNTLGAITYTSSNTSVATVNSSGKVHIVGVGSATITATLAATGCYNGDELSYTLTVTSGCDDVAGTIVNSDGSTITGDAIEMSACATKVIKVTGHTAADGVTYQWYKDGESLGSANGAQTDTYTIQASGAGEYYVTVTNTGDRHCAMVSTNTITVTNTSSLSIEKVVHHWYVKAGRRTPDIALAKATDAVDFVVEAGGAAIWSTVSGSVVKTGLGGCGFYMDKNGVIYLKGTKDNGDATDDITADKSLKILVHDVCNSGVYVDGILIHRQAATPYKEVAFVVDGMRGGAWNAVESGHADGTPLYEYLDSVGTAASARKFMLSERNIYKTTVDSTLRSHYSQFDAIIITDDPNTMMISTGKDSSKKKYQTEGYVNAMGTLIDVRPMLTMEAFVSALANWSAKGIAGNPSSPNPRQYEMRLECKDHEIYSGLPTPADGTHVWAETIGGEEYRHVIMVDSTKSPYNGVAYNASTSDMPALQGFNGSAAGSLLGLGRILNGSLQAAIERQEEPAARLMLFGLNAKALPNALTDEGKQVIANILTYLCKTNMEEVDDCSNYFTGKTSSDWSTTDNWSKGSLPNYETKVRILAPCEISGIQPHVAQVSIVNSGNSNIRYTATGNAVCDGTLTIEPDGALIADGKIRSAVAPHFAANDLMPTTPEMLTINTGSDAQAALIFNNEEGLTKATVNYYSLGRKEGGAYQYQYFAIPFEYLSVSPTFANENHNGTKIYTYVYNAGTGWARRGYYDDLYAFEGLGITTNTTAAYMDYTMTGTLASTATQEVSLSNAGDGYNLVGNSWMAPIQIAALSEDNTDTNITKTAYIYCTGHDGGTGVVGSGDSETPGQWLPIPFEATEFAEWKAAGKLSVIPAMQAFQIHTSAEATLTLDYSKVVRGSNNCLNEKLRAPRRNNSRSASAMSIIRVSDNNTYTDVCLIEGEQFSEAFDNGWEAKQMADEGVMQFYAMNGEDKMAVLATDELEGTPVCFAPGKESNYTISFFGGDGRYYLNDLKEEQSTAIEQGNTYSFTYEQGDMPHRFLISTTPFGIPSVTTGIGGVEAQEKVQKVIYNDHVYIIRGGKIYDVMGKMMK